MKKQWRAALRQLVCHASSSTRQRGLWRVEADGDRARRVERPDRGHASRAGSGLAYPRDPRQIKARRYRAASRRPGSRPAIRLWSARSGNGVLKWRASAACRPTSCCTMPQSTASRPRARRHQRNSAAAPGIGDKKLEHYGDETARPGEGHRSVSEGGRAVRRDHESRSGEKIPPHSVSCP